MFNKYFSNALAKREDDEIGILEEDEEKFRITSKDIAKENGIEYVEKVTENYYETDNYGKKRYYIKNRRYILLYPINSAYICKMEWYGVFGNNTKKILDNLHAFNCITNLDEILMQIVMLFDKYLDDDIVLSTEGFGLRLENKVEPNYSGRAKLILTEEAVLNSEISLVKFYAGKKYFINEFLDHFLGWNFGVAINNNPELKELILNYNKKVIKKGLRKPSEILNILRLNEEIQLFKLKTT